MARGATVLIADDDSSMRQTMEAIVRSAGMRPITVSSGEEALRAVQSSAVDVMLLDVQMPGIGGLEVLRQIREKHTDIGVIMISVLKRSEEHTSELQSLRHLVCRLLLETK